METDDLELLRQYAHHRSEPAFAELVRRHLDVVYSAALRQLRSPHSAEDVAQSVFLDLSRNAARIQPGTPLIAWLCTVTRRTAIDVIRRESRRHAREQAALEIASMKTTPPVWEQVEPLLDEALESLSETDRGALLLRYFENKSLREVGLRLGTSEDAAQKRVSRALEQLRGIFAKRGIVMTAAGLAGDLSAHAVQTAPSALVSSISAAAAKMGSLALTNLSAVEVTRTFAFSSLQKTIVALAAAAAVGFGLYQSTELLQLRAAIRASQERLSRQTSDLAQLKRERDDAFALRTKRERERDAMLSDAQRNKDDAALLDEMHAWYERADRLKQLAAGRPELMIPELKLLDEDTWISVAKDIQLDTETHILDALATLRGKGEMIFVNKLKVALSGYMEGSDGVLPKDLSELLPFFDSPMDPAIIARYELLQPGTYADTLSKGAMGIVGTRAPVDIERDAYLQVGPGSIMGRPFLHYDVEDARDAFTKAHDGRPPTESKEWIPYLKWPISTDTLKKFGFLGKP